MLENKQFTARKTAWRIMNKFNCAREYQLSKRRYEEMFIFHEHQASQGPGVGVSLVSVSVVTAIILAGLAWAGFLA